AVSREQARALALAAARKRQAEAGASDLPALPQEGAAGPGADTPAKPSMLDQATRQLGLGARSTWDALTSLPNMAHDAAASINNMAVSTFYPEGYDVTVNGKKEHRTGLLPSAVEAQNQALTNLGLPKPETTSEKVGDFANQFIIGAATGGPVNSVV